MYPMTQEKEKLLERIKRCLMLGDGTRNNSPEEAATAMEMAHKMMQVYNISLSEIQIDGMKQEKPVRGEGVEKKKFKKWEQYLSNVMAKFCSCGNYISNFYDTESHTNRQKMIFFGLENDVRIAEQTYSILRKVILRMATENGYEGKDEKSYCWGVIHTISKRIEAETKMTKEEEVKCTAVMVIKNQIVEEYRQKLNTELNLKTRKARTLDISSDAYAHGQHDGHSVNLRPNQNIIE